jgi:hypothetical protein
MLRSFYAYTRAYIPFVLVFLVLLSGVFVYKQINPDLSAGQRWQRIQDTWEPKQTAALQALSNDSSDFSLVVVDYANLKTSTQGWTNDIGKASDWASTDLSEQARAAVTADVQSLLDDTAGYIQTLTQAAAAKTNSDLDAVSQSLVTDSSTFATEISKVRLDLGLRAVNGSTPPPSGAGASGAPSGSASAGPSGSASASGSAAPSGSAAASDSASASPIASAT